MRIAFYGVGERAEPYLRMLARRPGIDVIGIWDNDLRIAEETAVGWKARVQPDAAALLADAPEAVWICAPASHQGDMALQCAQRRIPFFAVPPGCVDFERARAAARTLAGQNLVTAVGFPTRHTDIVREAREFLADTPVLLLTGSWLRTAVDEAPRDSVRTLWADASVLIDALRVFAGDVTRTWAVTVGEDSAGLSVQIQFAGGAAATLTCATLARPDSRASLEMHAPGSSLEFLDAFASLRLEEADRTSILRRMNNPAAEAATAFLEAVEANDSSAVEPSFSDAFRTLAVCRAAAISVAENRIVELSELL